MPTALGSRPFYSISHEGRTISDFSLDLWALPLSSVPVNPTVFLLGWDSRPLGLFLILGATTSAQPGPRVPWGMQ